MVNQPIDEKTLRVIERRHAGGLKSSELLELLGELGVALSEASLRKYVQLGLLPRSTRVGSKGKHKGSAGIYPVSIVRQVVKIKAMLASGYTIEQIQRDFLFVRSDIEQLQRCLGTIFDTLAGVLAKRSGEKYAHELVDEVESAKALGKDLVARLVAIEDRLTGLTRLRSVSVH